MSLRKWKGLFSVVYMGLIFYLSSIPNLKEPNVPFDPRKLTLHFIEYVILGFLLYEVFGNRIWETSIGVLYGISDEIHQYFVPGRVCDPFDALADALGVVAGWFLCCYFSRKLKRKGKRLKMILKL